MRAMLIVVVVVASGCRAKVAAPIDAGVPEVRRPGATAQQAIDEALALRARGDSSTATERLLAAARQARVDEDVTGEAVALHRAGDTTLDEDRCPDAKARYLEAQPLYLSTNDRARLGLLANDLGLWAKRCDRDSAVGWFSLAMSYRRDDPKAFALSANNLGVVFWESMHPEEANLAWLEALSAAERAGEPAQERKVLANLSLLWVLIAEGAYEGPGPDELLAALRDGGSEEDVDAMLERIHDRASPRPIDPASPALAKARGFFRRAIDAATRAGEDPIGVCGAFGIYSDRCEVLMPKAP
ncbi:MAG: hypothetical protein SFW67_06980 [Myxococcaceae bacterium]|nr:hypothetical protein [Myxococcaceae bacterium]